MRHVGDAGVGDDQRRLGVAVDERAQARGDRRQAAAAVDQDRHAALGGELEHRPEPLVGRVEALRARVQLDAARAGVEAARASSSGDSFRSRRTNGISRPPMRAAKASVRSFAALNDGCRSGSSRQNMNAREMPYSVHSSLELVVVADHPVDVVAEVEMGVEDVRVRPGMSARELRRRTARRARARVPRVGHPES